MLDIGRVAKPHGLKGQVVVELWTNRTERVMPGAALYAGDRRLEITRSSSLPDVGGRGRWLVSFAGVSTREEADRLRDTVLQADPLHVEGALWVHEMVGGPLYDTSGARVGQIEAVEANPASDLIVLEQGGLIPLRFVVEHSPGRVTVDIPPGLLDP